MLNDDMSQVVLVKGWKKGAKWSFPRGKINKDEKDLDCAIREVYEETGYDIQAAGLVPNDEDVKSLDQTMREQHMRLFVFRGVPMDTYFEPRTRKEISKISWYKLADLPTLKKERHMQQHGINGEDSLKMSNFYMVAPFIRNLKIWIKQQRKQDKIQGKPVPKRHAILEDGDEGEETPAVEEPSADEVNMETTDVEDSGHMDRLLSNLRSSHKTAAQEIPDSGLPEVSTAPMQTTDLAAELKRMLSVGGPTLGPSQPLPQEKDANPLMSILRGVQLPPSQQASNFARPPPPQTPFDQINSTPPQARTPHHPHSRPPPFSNMPPPAFPYPPTHGNQGDRFHPQGPRPFPNQPFPVNNGFVHERPSQVQQPQQYPMLQPTASYPGQGPQRGPAMQQLPKPWERSADFQSTSQFPQYNQGSVIPQASKLPPPKLTSHALNLLNVFKSPTPQTAAPANLPSNAPPIMPASGYGVNLPLPSQTFPQLLGQQSGSPSVLQPQATKPRNNQQDALLNLFRAPSTPEVAAGLEKVPSNPLSLEPVELSANSSPQVPRGHFQPPQAQQKLSMRRLPSLNTAPQNHPSRSPGLTSATVSGPLNAPDFESVKRRQRPAELGSGDSSSPKGIARGRGESLSPKRFATRTSQIHPMAILSRAPVKQQQPVIPPAQTRTPPVPVHTVTNRTPMEAPQPFHVTSILRRPNQDIVNMMVSSQSQSPKQMLPPPVPVQQKMPATILDKRADGQNEHKQSLLSLFGGGGMKPIPSGVKSVTATPPISALPGTTSGVGSPVSPLPTHAVPSNSKTRNGAGREDSLPISITSNPSITMVNEKSRINSIASLPSEAGTVIQQQISRRGTEKAANGPQTPNTPVDKNFLLGFLEKVAQTAPQGKQPKQL
jgi:mRNA-decapping enzyme subunit 2